VIGDLDSISSAARAAIPRNRLHLTPDQDTTDFDKALRAIDAPLILALGFAGARMDHGLAVMNTLVRHWQRPCIVIGPKDIAFVAPLRLSLHLRPGDTVSLFPLAPVTGSSQGLQWPLDGLHFAPDGMIATSNRATSALVRLRLSGPGMVALLPRTRLDAVITALASGPAAGSDGPAALGR
ncbi:MAG: thiamine pyrophosphokinase, partial [Paracoccaceae bacterium]